MKQFYVGLMSLFILANYSYASVLDMQSYVSKFLQNSEQYQENKLALKSAKLDLVKAEDLWQSRLDIIPMKGKSFFGAEGLADTIDASTANITGTYTQSLPWGLSAQLDAFKLIEEPVVDSAFQRSRVNLRLSQKLWRNAFGRGDNARIRQAEAALALRQTQLLAGQTQICQSAIDLYNKAYSAQEAVRIYKELLSAANKALSLTRRSYKKRLIRKIEYLSAQADHLRIQSEYQVAQKRFQQAQKELAIATESKSAPVLADPAGIFKNLAKEKSKPLKETLAYRALQKEREAAVEQALFVRDQNRTDVELGLELTHNESRTFVQNALVNGEEDRIMLNLRFSWDLLNDTRSANYTQSVIASELAAAKLKRTEEELEIRLNVLNTETVDTMAQIKMSKKKLAIFKKQIKEANRLLRAGKIEFEDYLRYRDAYLQESLNLLNQNQTAWGLAISKLAWNDNSKAICMGAI